MMSELGKTLVVIGLGIFLLGGLLWLSGGTLKNFPIGRLPGDILIQNGHFTFYFPLTTCILLSIGLSALLWLGQAITR
ncbi:DUF2905 domain-containing protein [Chroococcidiopsis sp. TS-821]|uniref:DUF2905 domain-containing protein n=1 Tax=Chroococcidiopsis sp. TS-821 TaxID=1378066 RepID=UPI000CED8B25|nr:DUF2905 domain-containing protein [Chroococcidiopsis sp. TS-821]PPS42829.1 hypothetical protein B1A85_14060 [Chroococcidiopsis sp. TS-821]